SRALDVDMFREDALFDDIQFIDFYRYCDVEVSDIYAFLDQHTPWLRPADTGRSTNCLINEVGIYLHKQQRGYHNYALPYSWDVRLGHKTRDEALVELNDEIDEQRVHEILNEIGYDLDLLKPLDGEQRLAAFFVADRPLTNQDIRTHLLSKLPDYMLPTYFIPLESLPLTPNGKIDRGALPALVANRQHATSAYAAPGNEIESQLASIWGELLGISLVGIHDNFFDLGGHSLPAIRIVARIQAAYGVEIPLTRFFEAPTIAQLALVIEELLLAQIEDLSDDEAQRLLDQLG
ncbi:MAG: hypothetical protein GYB67_06865, partial [Chloroflexi bacterium]|nr:hypothetical protein [Chloroflexota bacterium]